MFDFPKGDRHGEAHRHAALAEARGELVAHICDDDLWFPEHLAEPGKRYQPGAALVTAQNFWLCAWLWRYLDSPPAAKSQAQAAVTEFQGDDFFTARIGGSENILARGTN